jgi:hypothetical protein
MWLSFLTFDLLRAVPHNSGLPINQDKMLATLKAKGVVLFSATSRLMQALAPFECSMVSQDCAALYPSYGFDQNSCVLDERTGIARCGWAGASCKVDRIYSNCGK